MSASNISQHTNLKGKRKRKIPSNANPLFTKWLTEWKQEAEEKGWKSAHTYAKALRTLKMFPLPLASGKDCRLLQNFGDKICLMLDEKLAEYKRNHGILSIDAANNAGACSKSYRETSSAKLQISHKSSSSFRNRYNKDKSQDKISESTVVSSFLRCSEKSSAHKKGFGGVTSLQTELTAVSDVEIVPCQDGFSISSSVNGVVSTLRTHDISDSSDGEMHVMTSLEKKKPRASSTEVREYVPAYRSGPYALILTLYRSMQETEFKGYMTKSELLHAAQPFSDKSFTVPDAGSRYTAWSSMGTLIKKSLISRTSNPAKYTLTEAGCHLGKKLHTAGIYASATCNGSYQTSNCEMASSKITDVNMKSSLQNSEQVGRDCDISMPKIFSSRLFCSSQWNETSDDESSNHSRSRTGSTLSHSQDAPSYSSASFTSNSKGEDHLDNIAIIASRQAKKLVNSSEMSSYGSDSVNSVDNDDILIVSDEDDNGGNQIFPSRTWARFHTVSPSQSPPLQVSPLLKTSSSPRTFSQKLVPSRDNETERDHLEEERNSVKNPSQCLHSSSLCDQDILEICDSGDESDSNVQLKNFEDVNNKNFHASDDDDDELPDLFLPLSERLLQHGHGGSDLLKSLTCASSVQSLTPQSAVHADNEQTVSHYAKSESGLFTGLCTGPAHSRATHISHVSGTAGLVPQKALSHQHTSHSLESVNRLCNTAAYANNISVLQEDISIKKTVGTGCVSFRHPHFSQNLCPNPAFTLQPGSFDIILCLDNREFYGSKSSSKTLLPELMKTGIHCDLRLLHVGDLLWIARERVGPQSGRRAMELVLHYIVERKRMDDLVSSMTDGRLKEQKFRLKHCGLSEPIILIEDHGSIQNFSISEDRIRQSIVNSQIIDGFRVKHCGSAKDAVMYLATMTHFLCQHYSTKILHAVTLDEFKLLKGQQPLQKKEHFLIPFDVFNEASVKHKDLTVKEMFAKQLIQVPGVSADRAKAITNVYPSFSALMLAYEKCESDKEREKLLSGIRCGKKERNLGVALSRLLCMLYSQKGSLS